eukprot:COSAG01_NODE_198_length_22280_cov_21.529775_16_plen_166_part_00
MARGEGRHPLAAVAVAAWQLPLRWCSSRGATYLGRAGGRESRRCRLRSTAAVHEGLRRGLERLSGDPELGAAGASPTKIEEGVPPDAATQPEPATSPQDIDSWLAAAKLEKYCAAIKEYGYDSFEALCEATEDEIKDMMADPDVNMKKPHQKLMLKAWQELTRDS